MSLCKFENVELSLKAKVEQTNKVEDIQRLPKFDDFLNPDIDKRIKLKRITANMLVNFY